jgi:hypothetical protein
MDVFKELKMYGLLTDRYVRRAPIHPGNGWCHGYMRVFLANYN